MLELLAPNQSYTETLEVLPINAKSPKPGFNFFPCSKYFLFWLFCPYWWEPHSQLSKNYYPNYMTFVYSDTVQSSLISSWFCFFLDACLSSSLSQATDTGVICASRRAVAISAQTALIWGCLFLNMIILEQKMVLMRNKFHCTGHFLPFSISLLKRQDVHFLYFYPTHLF